MTNDDWRRLIVDLVLIKQELARVDKKGLWEFHLPSVAATEAEILASEHQLGEGLASSYREFLAYADGWPAFYQSVDLFGARDLVGGRKSTLGAEMLSYVEDVALQASGLRRADLLPIAASPIDRDLFVLTRNSCPTPGLVVWFAGSEIDRYLDFKDFFIAMIEYNRMELRHMQAGGSPARG